MFNKLRNVYKECIVGCVIFLIVIYVLMPSYYVHTSWVETSNNHEIIVTTLNVIVYKSRFSKALYKRIEEEHSAINGQVTELRMNLYQSERHFSNNEPYKKIIADYSEMKYKEK